MTADQYRSVAAVYDRCISPLLRTLREEIRAYIHFRGFTRVIDVCCGTGDQLRLMEGHGMELTGIDNSVAMLAKARQKCAPTTDLHLLAADQASFEPGRFDCAILTFSLHEKHPADCQAIYENSRRLVRQGGTLIVADYVSVPATPKGMLIGRLLIPCIERCAGRAHYSYYRQWLAHGALEAFLKRREKSTDILSYRFGSCVLCCSVNIDDTRQTLEKSIELLNRSLSNKPGPVNP